MILPDFGLLGFVLRSQRANHACRVSRGHRIGGNVACDDGPGADNRAVADPDARADDHPSAQPAVVADGDWAARFEACTALRRVERMQGREQLHFGADQRVTADADRSQVEERAAEVDERMFADRDIIPVIAVERFADEAFAAGA